MPQLIPSSMDKQEFTKEVWKKVVRVTNRMQAVNGIVLIPKEIEHAMKKCRPIALRHQRGDFRHTEEEMRYEQDVARWLVEKWSELNNVSVPPMRFGPHN